MKKTSLLTILLCCSFFSFGLLAQGFGGGTGIATDPFIISEVAHMEAMHDADYTNPVYYKLTADIDMAGVNWVPINSVEPYTNHVHFDGNGHVIKNLTVLGQTYGSLFGVLCGSCKNLGVIDANIESTNGGGIIAGYAGLKGPGKPTGMITNCYTTGIVRGSDAVGGIVGNIGKPNGSDYSGVRNCYSTATVIANNTIEKSRAGGIVGIVFAEGILENSYATGTVRSSRAGAGGVAGWTDKTVKGLVAMNDSVINDSIGNVGRIAAFMGRVDDVIAQGENCWASENTVVKNADYVLVEADYKQDEVTERNTPFDGITKSVVFLSDPMSYFLELEWDFASAENIWAQTMSNGKPIFQWLFDREDYQLIDGHATQTGIHDAFLQSTKVYFHNKQLHVQSDNTINAIRVFNATGQLIYRNLDVNARSMVVDAHQKGVHIVSVLSEGNWATVKVLNQ